MVVPGGEQVFEIPGDEPEPVAPPSPIETAPAPEAPSFAEPLVPELPPAQEDFAPIEPPAIQAPSVSEPLVPEPPPAQEDFTPIEPPSPPHETAAPAVVPPPSPVPDEIETPTMAELYASQGHFERAIAVYRNLLVRSPNETQYRERIEELEMLRIAAASKPPVSPAQAPAAGGDGPVSGARQKTIEILGEWLDAIRRSREA